MNTLKTLSSRHRGHMSAQNKEHAEKTSYYYDEWKLISQRNCEEKYIG